MTSVPETMRCVEISQPGGPEVLRVVERPVPPPGTNEVLVRVTAAGVNRPDLLQRQGRYPPPPGATDIPGLEIAGTIAALGEGVAGSALAPGARVCALVAGGGYAEYCVVPVPQCLSIPGGLDDRQAAAIPETYFTVWTNLFDRGRLAADETVLIHGGTSGIGTTATQLATAFGARAITTSGTGEKCDACLRLGARLAVNYRTADFVEEVRRFTNGRGVDVVLDIIGGDYLARNIDCLATNGRLVQIGLQGGARAQVSLAAIMQRRLTITGSTLRPRTTEEKGLIARALERDVWPWLAHGIVGPVVHGVLPLADAAEAHRQLEAGNVIGKLVLAV